MTSAWPDKWRGTRLKYESTLKGRLGWQGLKADEYRDEGPYVVSSAHFLTEKVQWHQCPRVSEERYHLDTNIQLRPLDILLMKDGAALGKLAYVDSMPGPACLNSHLLLLRPQNRAYEPKYFFYLATTGIFQDYMQVYGTGATFMGVSQRDIGNFPLAFPSLEEQTQIAKFLDYETAKIDALIEKQQQLIALLKEKRQAVISHAVTKGLNPDVPMRDSGVEWLGEIPAHWEFAPLGYLTEEITVGIVVTPSKFYEDDGVPCLRSLNVRPGYLRKEELVYISQTSNELHSKSMIRSGDVVIVRTGQPGTAAMVEEELDGCNCIDLIIVRRTRRLLPAFLVYQMNANHVALQVSAGSGGAIQQHFNVRVAKKLKVLVPPEDEQLKIVRYLDEQSTRFDLLISRAEDAANLLAERRTALISAAVTGKIDVRSWKPPESATRAAGDLR